MTAPGYAFERIRLSDSRTLVEASAGTGKTFTIQHLVLRLVVEAGNWDGLPAGAPLPMRHLLVITFTRNAAGELRDRIATALQNANLLAANLVAANPANEGAFEAWIGAQQDPDSQPILALLRQWVLQDAIVDANTTTIPRRVQLVRQRLAQAQVDLDLALISTIHSWAQRIVQQKAFASGIRVAQEFTESDAWLETAAADLLRDCHQRGMDWLLPTSYNLQQAMRDLGMALAFDPQTEQMRPNLADLDPQLVPNMLRELLPVFADEALALQTIFDEAATHQVYRGGKTNYYARALEWLGLAQDLFAGFDGIHTPGLAAVLRDVHNMAGYGSHSWITKSKAPELVEQLQGLQTIRTLHRLATETAEWSHWPLVRQRAEALQDELRGRGLLSFDQLLLQARDAVRQQPQLGAQLRQLFPVAIVDEFQDTDPVQYALFQQVYPRGNGSHSLVLVGDPKQSIYLFRQADVQCYLRARDHADNLVQLTRNFRADAPLVEALNLTYEKPILGPQDVPDYTAGLQVNRRSHNILYEPVTAAHPARLTRHDRPVTPLQIASLPVTDDRASTPALVPISGGVDFQQIARNLARQVVHLLDPTNGYCIDGRAVGAGDIAILIRSHARATAVYRALHALGVPVVRQTRHSVFHSREGAELVWILRAMETPADPRLLRSAAAARCFGTRPEDLADGATVQAELQTMVATAAALVETRGIYAALDRLLRDSQGFVRLAGRRDGLRILSNLRQGMELLQQAQSEGYSSTTALLQWLHERRAGDADLAGEHELERLENDAEAVRIHTIFASKGLEYPIVLCPDLANSYSNPRYPTKLDLRALGVQSNDGIERYMVLNSSEKKLAEAIAADHQNDLLRQLYVALTRAQHMVWVLWFETDWATNRGKSPLARWLHGTQGKEAVVPLTERRDYGQCSTNGVPLVTIQPWNQQDLNGTQPRATSSPESLQPPSEELLPQAFADRSSWSFSRLAHQAEHTAPVEQDDVASDPSEWQTPADPQIALANQARLAAFTPGAHTGNFVHDVFEMVDFPTAAVDQTTMLQQVQASGARFTPVLRNTELLWDDPAMQEQTATELQAVLQTEIAPFGFCLAQLARPACFRELEFHLQLRADTRLGLLQQLLAGTDSLPADDRQLSGMLKGFIDLLAIKDRQLYIIDYKSNLLPAYDPNTVAHSVYAAHYDWQYKLYAVAVQRFCELMNRRHGTDFRLGGIAYLYVRGMQPGSPDGIHAATVDQLSPHLQALHEVFA